MESWYACSIKFQLPGASINSQNEVGDTELKSAVIQTETAKTENSEGLPKEKFRKTEKSDVLVKERALRKNKKEKEKEKVSVKNTTLKSKLEKRLLVLPLESSVVAIFLLLLLGAFYVVHCVWAATEAYSAPSFVLTSRTHDGLHVFDDFREAYSWLSHNTDVDDKVASLWLPNHCHG